MDETLCTKIRVLLGKEVVIDGRRFLVHELLKDCESLVLMPLDQPYSIQADQYGDPRRRAQETLTLPLKSSLSDDLNPVIQQILDQT
jgi:hypothetical protein